MANVADLTPAAFAAQAQPVWWRYETNRGYGASWNVPAFVLGEVPERKRVPIAAQMRDGTWVPRWVQPWKLTPRSPHGY